MERLLVKAGQHVVAGELIASIADDGTIATQQLQARSDLATARLELAQKQMHDPSRGPQPTPAEFSSLQASVRTAQAKLGKLLGPPLPAELATARAEYEKAVADAGTGRAGSPSAIAAADLAVAASQQKLRSLTGQPAAGDVAAAQLELAKATLELDNVNRVPTTPGASAVAAADAAIALAQRKLADAQATGTATDVAAAAADLAKARADRDALYAATPGPTPAARTAAQLAVDAATRRIQDLSNPPAGLLSVARQELAKAEADAAAQRAAHGPAVARSQQAAVAAARAKLAQLVRGAPGDVRSAGLADLRKAQADLAVLRQRGAPASATDLALGRLKLDVSRQRLALAEQLSTRLAIRSPASGTITSVLSAQGAAVDLLTPVARVEDLDHIVVTLDLTEFDVGMTRVGATAQVSVDALGGRRFSGQVTDVALTGFESGGVVTFPVIIGLPRPKGLRPGMSVSVRVLVAEHKNVVRVPTGAIIDSGASRVVHVRSGGGTIVERQVEVGLTGTDTAEIISGVRPGERIVVPAAAAGGNGP